MAEKVLDFAWDWTLGHIAIAWRSDWIGVVLISLGFFIGGLYCCEWLAHRIAQTPKFVIDGNPSIIVDQHGEFHVNFHFKPNGILPRWPGALRVRVSAVGEHGTTQSDEMSTEPVGACWPRKGVKVGCKLPGTDPWVRQLVPGGGASISIVATVGGWSKVNLNPKCSTLSLSIGRTT